MSILDKIDNEIFDIIEDLRIEFGRAFTSDNRKSEIITQISELRASLNSPCNCKDKD